MTAASLARTPVDGSLDLFDHRPIMIDGFQLRTRAAVPVGKPKLDQWIYAMQFAHATADSAPYWWGDLMRYAESRGEWKERMTQALEVTGLARQTLLNYTSVCNQVEEHERRLAPSVAHAAEVQALERPEQTEWLERASTEGWSVRELRVEMRAARRRRVIEGQAVLEGMYRVIYADYPWPYNDNGPTVDGSLGKAERHYPGMPIEEGLKLPVEAHALPDAVLFFWVTATMLYEEPGPREIIKAWGFKPKTGFVWDKVLGMPGSYSHVVHEHLIVATRGSCLPDVPLPQTKSIITERRSTVHSEKPRAARAMIEKHWTRGPYLELFGRDRVSGWSVFGNDARLWAEEALA